MTDRSNAQSGRAVCRLVLPATSSDLRPDPVGFCPQTQKSAYLRPDPLAGLEEDSRRRDSLLARRVPQGSALSVRSNNREGKI